MNGPRPGGKTNTVGGSLICLMLALLAPLAVLCYPVFQPHQVMWANDSQLGAIKAACARLPDTFTGHWADNYWVGMEIPSSSPTLATLLQMLISPELYMKIFTPVTMVLLGFSAWLLFRQLRFSPMVCVMGGLAAGLNMHFFSVACWGLGTWNICCAMIFLALAALVAPGIRQTWIKGALAGLAVGMSVMEGFDSGAILSVYVGVFALFLCLTTQPAVGKALVKSVELGVVMVFFAMFIAASTLSTLVGTQIKAISGMGQTAAEKEAHWNFATQWSLPKLETLRVIIPGIFGYRMREFTTTTDKSDSYWGGVGEDPIIGEVAAKLDSGDPKVRADTAASLKLPEDVVGVMQNGSASQRAEIRERILESMPLQRRHSGNGEYAGVLVAVLAIFAVASACRPGGSPYSLIERRMVWFFGAAALFSLLAAWGRNAPLYAVLYKLPYFSTIRNPIKFMHPFHITWIILAGFGLEALSRRCLGSENPRGTVSDQLKRWWAKPLAFDKKWTYASLLFLGLSVVAWMLFSSSKIDLVKYLTTLGDPNYQGFNSKLGNEVATFAVHQAGWFVFYLALSLASVLVVLSGAWSGRRAKWAWIFFGAIIICDLSRSDARWVRYFDYTEKYSMNPITDFLRQHPYEHRVVGPRLSPEGKYDLAGDGNFGALCHWWLENDFPYNDIQSLDIDQWPRMPVLETHYLGNFGGSGQAVARFWQLTNTRYILANAGVAAALNQTGDPNERAFVIRDRFTFTDASGQLLAKPGVTQVEDSGDLAIEINDKGTFALIEFAKALPRAKLYGNWKSAGDEDTLQTLRSASFDPSRTVLVSPETSVAQGAGDTNADAGTVAIMNYQPKDIKLTAHALTPAVLLFNERIAAPWKVSVDGRPSTLLRCNYLMQGVFLPAGDHLIEFRFQPPILPLYISLAAFAAGILLAAYLMYTHWTALGQKDPSPSCDGAQPPQRGKAKP